MLSEDVITLEELLRETETFRLAKSKLNKHTRLMVDRKMVDMLHDSNSTNK